MVSKWWIEPNLRDCISSIENLRRIEAIDFFVNSFRFNFNANTCDLSTNVSDRSSELKSGGTREAAGVARCFFCFAWRFGLDSSSFCCRRDKTPDPDKTAPQLNASEAVSAATAAMSDMGQFCKRQPTACEVGSQAATVIGQRAQGGARKLYQIITDKPEKSDKRAPDHTGSIGGMESAEVAQSTRMIR